MIKNLINEIISQIEKTIDQQTIYMTSDIKGHILTIIATLAVGIALGGIISLWEKSYRLEQEIIEMQESKACPEGRIGEGVNGCSGAGAGGGD